MPKQVKDDTLIFAEILNKGKMYADGLDIDIFADDMTALHMWVNDQDDTALVFSREVRVSDNDKVVLFRVTTLNTFVYGEADAVRALIASA